MKKLFKIDLVLLISFLLLVAIGIFTLYTLTLTNLPGKSEALKSEFTNQLIFLVFGVVISIVTFTVSYNYFKFRLILSIIYAITFLALLFTILFGLEIRGVKRWITIGGKVTENGTLIGGLTIQASEFAKVALILVTAGLLSQIGNLSNEARSKLTRSKAFLYEYKNIILALILNIVALGLIFAQRSLSVTSITTLIISSLFFAKAKNKLIVFLSLVCFFLALIMAQNSLFKISLSTRIIFFLIPLGIYVFSVYSQSISEKTIFIVIAAGIITGAVFVNVTWNYLLRDFQKERIEGFFKSDRSEKDEGYQQFQSKLSIGAGQVYGQGMRQVSDSRLLLLPEPTTDFIFAILGFKFGFAGSLIVVGLYLTVILRLYYLADQMNDQFSSLVLTGVATMILLQFFLNIAMNIDIIPVGGTTLPFLSAGGSSLVSMLIAVTICQNIIATNRLEKSIYRRKDKVLINGWNI